MKQRKIIWDSQMHDANIQVLLNWLHELAKQIITAPGKDAGMLLTNFPPKGWLAFEELKARSQSDLLALKAALLAQLAKMAPDSPERMLVLDTIHRISLILAPKPKRRFRFRAPSPWNKWLYRDLRRDIAFAVEPEFGDVAV
mgnify:CR=1 FL=1